MTRPIAIRRRLVLNYGMAAGMSGLLLPGLAPRSAFAQAGQSARKQFLYGQQAGGMQVREYVRSIGFASGASCCYNDPGHPPGNAIDTVIFNGNDVCGRPDKKAPRRTEVLHLDEGEWISDVDTIHWTFLHYVKLGTNKRRWVESAGPGHDTASGKAFLETHKLRRGQLSGVRVLQIGIWGGWVVGGLDIEYVENYRPSTLVKSNVDVILDSAAPGSTTEIYEDASLNTLNSIERSRESVKSLEVNASVEAEHFVKVAVSTKIQTSDTSKETMQAKTDQLLKSGKKTKGPDIGPDSTGFQMGRCDLMRSSTGKYFLKFVSTQGSGWVVLKKYDGLIGAFDLSAGASLQAGLKHDDSEVGIRRIVGVR